jgi:hypothetical protein
MTAYIARRKGLVLGDPPSSGRTNGESSRNANGNGAIERVVPQKSTISHFDFAFSTSTHAGLRNAVRLFNFRGVVTHAVIIGSETSGIALTAYVEKKEGEATMPEMSLRVDGIPGSLPQIVNSRNVQEGATSEPDGVRWTVLISPTKTETRLDVIVTKPGALAESIAIYVNRMS